MVGGVVHRGVHGGRGAKPPGSRRARRENTWIPEGGYRFHLDLERRVLKTSEYGGAGLHAPESRKIQQKTPGSGLRGMQALSKPYVTHTDTLLSSSTFDDFDDLMAIASRVIQSPRALRNRLRITIELQVTLTVCEHRDKYNATPPCLTCHHTIVVNHAPQTRAAIRIWQAATNTSCVSAVRENQILSCAHYAVIRPSTSTACESDVALNVLMTHKSNFSVCTN